MSYCVSYVFIWFVNGCHAIPCQSRFQAKEGIFPAHYRLICYGVQLAVVRSLSNYNIQREPTLDLVPAEAYFPVVLHADTRQYAS